jgi:hypothetical protein
MMGYKQMAIAPTLIFTDKHNCQHQLIIVTIVNHRFQRNEFFHSYTPVTQNHIQMTTAEHSYFLGYRQTF